jgi:hypothetical protein
MIDTLPLWFWLPLALILWPVVVVMGLRWYRTRLAEIEAEEACREAYFIRNRHGRPSFDPDAVDAEPIQFYDGTSL